MHTLVVIGLLFISNILMTFAWYWHIKSDHPSFALWQIVLISWAVALFEYCFAVPANHFGAHWGLKPFQLKVLQEVIALTVFALFAVIYLKEDFRLNYLYSFICILGAVYFIFRK